MSLERTFGEGPCRESLLTALGGVRESDFTGLDSILQRAREEKDSPWLLAASLDYIVLFERHYRTHGTEAFDASVAGAFKSQHLFVFIEQLKAIAQQVCRIEIPAGNGCGTGFLIGPSMIMTNYHVYDVLRKDGYSSLDLRCRFDYILDPETGDPSPGTAYRLAEADWLVKTSEELALDYAVLRLADPVGEQLLSANRKRGWLTPAKARIVERDEPLIVVQHPAADLLQIALGFALSINRQTHRIAHSANTAPGSSGSPCFTQDGKLVGLHHWGDRDGNQAIMLDAIIDDCPLLQNP